MARIFDTVESYVEYIQNLSYRFVSNEMNMHVLDKVREMAKKHVYNPYSPTTGKGFTPRMYKWTYSLLSLSYYKMKSKMNRNFTTTKSSISAYVYSTSPHVNSVVNGTPYEHRFKYYGVERPFIKEANELLLEPNQISLLESKARKFYESYGFKTT